MTSINYENQLSVTGLHQVTEARRCTRRVLTKSVPSNYQHTNDIFTNREKRNVCICERTAHARSALRAVREQGRDIELSEASARGRTLVDFNPLPPSNNTTHGLERRAIGISVRFGASGVWQKSELNKHSSNCGLHTVQYSTVLSL